MTVLSGLSRNGRMRTSANACRVGPPKPSQVMKTYRTKTFVQIAGTVVVAVVAMIASGCKGSGESGVAAVTPPSRSGDVWEADLSRGRAASPAALTAFVNGVHVMVLDGDDVFAGMRKLQAKGSEDGRTVDFSNGITAKMVSAGDSLEAPLLDRRHAADAQEGGPLVSARRFWGIGAMALLAPLGAASVQGDHLDVPLVALTYHKVSGDPLDFQAAAQGSEEVARASNFDRPDVLARTVDALKAQLASADPSREFVMNVDDNITEYDHAAGEFSIQLFKPGYSVPLTAFGQQYQLVFANAESVRAIPMPKEQARDFDTQLNGFGRRVTDEIHFRVVGRGDPSGAVTGPRVVTTQIVAVRVLDPTGRVLFTPSPGNAAAASQPVQARFDIATADVAGLRVGTSADDLEATLKRLFGPVTREAAGRSALHGSATVMTVNDAGCYSMPGKAKSPEPGAVCVTAYVDDHDVVRAIRIERVFAWFDSELFRKTLVQKYGTVAAAANGGGYSLGWGPVVDANMTYDSSGPHTALAAYYEENDDFMSRGLNKLSDIRVVLSIVDPDWAKQTK